MRLLRKICARLALCSEVSKRTYTEAREEHLTRQSHEAVRELGETTERLKGHAENVAQSVDSNRSDIERLLGHIKKISTSAEDATMLLEQMMIRRRADGRDGTIP